MQKAHYHIVFFGFSIALLLLLQNCQTQQAEETVALEKGDWVRAPEPYPAYQPVQEVHTSKDGSKTRLLKYQLWDMDRDGQPDLLRQLDEKGNVTFTAYDFNLPE